MNLELTTENLKKLCRICLDDGVFNIWEYKIKILSEELSNNKIHIGALDNEDDEMAQSESSPLQMQDTDIAAYEMMQIFSKYEDELLPMGMEMPMLCQQCLVELKQSYCYYVKAQRASREISKYYKMAVDIEKEPSDNSASHDIEIEYLDEFLQQHQPQLQQEKTTYEQQQQQTQQNVAEIALADKVEQQVVEPHGSQERTIVEETQSKRLQVKRKLIKQPTFVLTGGVSKMLTNIKPTLHEAEVSAVPSTSTQNTKPASASGSSPQKRQRLQRERHVNNMMGLPPTQRGSLIVGQFIPTMVTVPLDAETSASGTTKVVDAATGATVHANICAETQALELRSIDYAAVEIKHMENIDSVLLAAAKSATAGADATATDDNAELLDYCAPSTDDAVYICKYCPQAFAAPHYLMTHIRKCHVCKFCTQAFATCSDLCEHVNREHQEHKCPICGKELTTHRNLRSHIKRMHGIKLPTQIALLDYRVVNEDNPADIEIENEPQAQQQQQQQQQHMQQQEAQLLEQFQQTAIPAEIELTNYDVDCTEDHLLQQEHDFVHDDIVSAIVDKAVDLVADEALTAATAGRGVEHDDNVYLSIECMEPSDV